jgi:hypothetical protein
MKAKTLIIEPTVGFMLKVMKSGTVIRKFKREFASIRHGNYFEFVKLIKGKVPQVVVYRAGTISVEKSMTSNDCDFVGLLKASPSLEVFHKNCLSFYGPVVDADISDEIYGKLVLFEIALRMHANNNLLIDEREDLEVVIDKVGKFKSLSQSEIDSLHLGRRFLNMIKHNSSQFPSWGDGITAFQSAFQILEMHRLMVV